MTLFTAIYVFMGLATAIAWCDNTSWQEVVACALLGVTWPLLLTVKTLQKLFR